MKHIDHNILYHKINEHNNLLFQYENTKTIFFEATLFLFTNSKYKYNDKVCQLFIFFDHKYKIIFMFIFHTSYINIRMVKIIEYLRFLF